MVLSYPHDRNTGGQRYAGLIRIRHDDRLGGFDYTYRIELGWTSILFFKK